MAESTDSNCSRSSGKFSSRGGKFPGGGYTWSVTNYRLSTNPKQEQDLSKTAPNLKYRSGRDILRDIEREETHESQTPSQQTQGFHNTLAKFRKMSDTDGEFPDTDHVYDDEPGRDLDSLQTSDPSHGYHVTTADERATTGLLDSGEDAASQTSDDGEGATAEEYDKDQERTSNTQVAGYGVRRDDPTVSCDLKKKNVVDAGEHYPETHRDWVLMETTAYKINQLMKGIDMMASDNHQFTATVYRLDYNEEQAEYYKGSTEQQNSTLAQHALHQTVDEANYPNNLSVEHKAAVTDYQVADEVVRPLDESNTSITTGNQSELGPVITLVSLSPSSDQQKTVGFAEQVDQALTHCSCHRLNVTGCKVKTLKHCQEKVENQLLGNTNHCDSKGQLDYTLTAVPTESSIEHPSTSQNDNSLLPSVDSVGIIPQGVGQDGYVTDFDYAIDTIAANRIRSRLKTDFLLDAEEGLNIFMQELSNRRSVLFKTIVLKHSHSVCLSDTDIKSIISRIHTPATNSVEGEIEATSCHMTQIDDFVNQENRKHNDFLTPIRMPCYSSQSWDSVSNLFPGATAVTSIYRHASDIPNVVVYDLRLEHNVVKDQNNTIPNIDVSNATSEGTSERVALRNIGGEADVTYSPQSSSERNHSGSSMQDTSPHENILIVRVGSSRAASDMYSESKLDENDPSKHETKSSEATLPLPDRNSQASCCSFLENDRLVDHDDSTTVKGNNYSDFVVVVTSTTKHNSPTNTTPSLADLSDGQAEAAGSCSNKRVSSLIRYFNSLPDDIGQPETLLDSQLSRDMTRQGETSLVKTIVNWLNSQPLSVFIPVNDNTLIHGLNNLNSSSTNQTQSIIDHFGNLTRTLVSTSAQNELPILRRVKTILPLERCEGIAHTSESNTEDTSQVNVSKTSSTNSDKVETIVQDTMQESLFSEIDDTLPILSRLPEDPKFASGYIREQARSRLLPNDREHTILTLPTACQECNDLNNDLCRDNPPLVTIRKTQLEFNDEIDNSVALPSLALRMRISEKESPGGEEYTAQEMFNILKSVAQLPRYSQLRLSEMDIIGKHSFRHKTSKMEQLKSLLFAAKTITISSEELRSVANYTDLDDIPGLEFVTAFSDISDSSLVTTSSLRNASMPQHLTSNCSGEELFRQWFNSMLFSLTTDQSSSRAVDSLNEASSCTVPPNNSTLIRTEKYKSSNKQSTTCFKNPELLTKRQLENIALVPEKNTNSAFPEDNTDSSFSHTHIKSASEKVERMRRISESNRTLSLSEDTKELQLSQIPADRPNIGVITKKAESSGFIASPTGTPSPIILESACEDMLKNNVITTLTPCVKTVAHLTTGNLPNLSHQFSMLSGEFLELIRVVTMIYLSAQSHSSLGLPGVSPTLSRTIHNEPNAQESLAQSTIPRIKTSCSMNYMCRSSCRNISGGLDSKCIRPQSKFKYLLKKQADNITWDNISQTTANGLPPVIPSKCNTGYSRHVQLAASTDISTSSSPEKYLRPRHQAAFSSFAEDILTAEAASNATVTSAVVGTDANDMSDFNRFREDYKEYSTVPYTILQTHMRKTKLLTGTGTYVKHLRKLAAMDFQKTMIGMVDELGWEPFDPNLDLAPPEEKLIHNRSPLINYQSNPPERLAAYQEDRVGQRESETSFELLPDGLSSNDASCLKQTLSSESDSSILFTKQEQPSSHGTTSSSHSQLELETSSISYSNDCLISNSQLSISQEREVAEESWDITGSGLSSEEVSKTDISDDMTKYPDPTEDGCPESHITGFVSSFKPKQVDACTVFDNKTTETDDKAEIKNDPVAKLAKQQLTIMDDITSNKVGVKSDIVSTFPEHNLSKMIYTGTYTSLPFFCNHMYELRPDKSLLTASVLYGSQMFPVVTSVKSQRPVGVPHEPLFILPGLAMPSTAANASMIMSFAAQSPRFSVSSYPVVAESVAHPEDRKSGQVSDSCICEVRVSGNSSLPNTRSSIALSVESSSFTVSDTSEISSLQQQVVSKASPWDCRPNILTPCSTSHYRPISPVEIPPADGLSFTLPRCITPRPPSITSSGQSAITSRLSSTLPNLFTRSRSPVIRKLETYVMTESSPSTSVPLSIPDPDDSLWQNTPLYFVPVTSSHLELSTKHVFPMLSSKHENVQMKTTNFIDVDLPHKAEYSKYEDAQVKIAHVDNTDVQRNVQFMYNTGVVVEQTSSTTWETFSNTLHHDTPKVQRHTYHEFEDNGISTLTSDHNKEVCDKMCNDRLSPKCPQDGTVNENGYSAKYYDHAVSFESFQLAKPKACVVNRHMSDSGKTPISNSWDVSFDSAKQYPPRRPVDVHQLISSAYDPYSADSSHRNHRVTDVTVGNPDFTARFPNSARCIHDDYTGVPELSTDILDSTTQVQKLRSPSRNSVDIAEVRINILDSSHIPELTSDLSDRMPNLVAHIPDVSVHQPNLSTFAADFRTNAVRYKVADIDRDVSEWHGELAYNRAQQGSRVSLGNSEWNYSLSQKHPGYSTGYLVTSSAIESIEPVNSTISHWVGGVNNDSEGLGHNISDTGCYDNACQLPLGCYGNHFHTYPGSLVVSPHAVLSACDDPPWLQLQKTAASARPLASARCWTQGSGPDRTHIPSTQSSDTSSLLIENELMETQIRKLRGENSRLQTENKLWKTKYNEAEARVTTLKRELTTVKDEAREARRSKERDNQMQAIKLKSLDQLEKNKQELESEVEQLNNQLQMLQRHKSSLQNKSKVGHSSSGKFASTGDNSSLLQGLELEVDTLKGELQRTKHRLTVSEHAQTHEADQKQRIEEQLVKLTKMNELLQEQFSGEGRYNSAERQVFALERRLKITEDRLRQERADRASKLTEVEQNLILENAKLKVSDHESRRQLQREIERNKVLERKYKEVKIDNESLLVQREDIPECLNGQRSSPHTSPRKTGNDNTKLSEESKYIMQQVKNEANLGPTQEQDIICYLWRKNRDSSQHSKELEISLSELKIDRGSVKDGLKALREREATYERELQKYNEKLDDVRKRHEDTENTFTLHTKELVQQKHEANTKLKSLEDANIALSAENESLKSTALNGSSPTNNEATNVSAQVEILTKEQDKLKTDEQRLRRSVKMLEDEADSLRQQLRAKQLQLDGVLQQEQSGQAREESTQQKANDLTVQLDQSRAELGECQEKYDKMDEERCMLLDKLADEANKLEKVEKAAAEAKENADSQIEYLRRQLRNKSRVLQNKTDTDSDREVEVVSSKKNLKKVNQELEQKSTQLKLLTVGLKEEREKVSRLEADLDKVDGQLSEDLASLAREGKLGTVFQSGSASSLQALTEADIATRKLKRQNENLQVDKMRANAVIEDLVKENSSLVAKIREEQQQLGCERAKVCQLNGDKKHLQQQIRILFDTKNNSEAEKQKIRHNLSQHEENIAQILQKLKVLQSKPGESQPNYQLLNPEGKQLAMELQTSQTLLAAREREVELLRDTLQEQKLEEETLSAKMAVLEEENQASHSAFKTLTNQLSVQFKESAITTEDQHPVMEETNTLHLEKVQPEKPTEKGKRRPERRLTEISFLEDQVKRAQEKQRETEEHLDRKDNRILELEAELRNYEKQLTQLENERGQMRGHMEKMNHEIRGLMGLSGSPRESVTDGNTVKDEPSVRSDLREEVADVVRQMEVIKQEYLIATQSLQAEKTKTAQLMGQCESEEEKSYYLAEHVKTLELDLQVAKTHLVEAQRTIDQYKQDKQTLYQDVEELCAKLAKKDEIINDLQGQSGDTVNKLRDEHTEQKNMLTERLQTAEHNLSTTQADLDEAREKLRRKELQLDALHKTKLELQHDNQSKDELEAEVKEQESELHQLKVSVQSLQVENSRLIQENKDSKETLERADASKQALREQMHDQREEMSSEILRLTQQLSEETRRRDTDKDELQDQLNRANAKLKATEMSLSTVSETKDSLHQSTQSYQDTLDTLKTHLHEEITSRKLADQRVETLTSQLRDVTNQKAEREEVNSDLKGQVIRLELERNNEKDKYKKLKKDLSVTKNSTQSHEAHSQLLHMHGVELQEEVGALRNQLKAVKQDLSGKNKRLTLDLKQQAETFEHEQKKLVAHAQQLSVDLEQTREMLALKNRENLKLQEEVLISENQLRESAVQVKTAHDTVKMEADERTMLDKRNTELELLLAKMRTREEEDKLESTRNDVQKMLAQLTKKMQDQFDKQRGSDNEVRTRDQKKLSEYKKKINQLEALLSREQAANVVTKTQLSSAEDDNQRLRHQLQSLRKRFTSTEPERPRDRMEEINEIIMRSQTRAHQLLASGSYGDDPFKTLNPSRDFQTSLPATSQFMTSLPATSQFMTSLPVTSQFMTPTHFDTLQDGRLSFNSEDSNLGSSGSPRGLYKH